MSQFDPVIDIAGRGTVKLSKIHRSGKSRKYFLGTHAGSRDQVYCLCTGRPGIAMGVAHRQIPQEQFYLYPLRRDDPQKHKHYCPHYANGTKQSPSRKPPATVEDDGEHVNVNLTSPTYRKLASDTPSRPAHRSTGPTAGSPRGQLLTLLELLWHHAGLDWWSPSFYGKRRYGLIQHRLCETAKKFSVKGFDLAPRFFMPPPFQHTKKAVSDKAFNKLLAAIDQEDGNGRRMYGYVVGVLRDWQQDDDDWIALSHLGPRIYADKGSLAKEVMRWGFFPHKTVVICRVEPKSVARGKHQILKLVELACLTISNTKSWIPVDSNYERELCQELEDAEFVFRKPLQACDAETQQSLGVSLRPDFIIDEEPDSPICMEVFGMLDNPKYQTHAESKIDQYMAAGLTCWFWDTRQPMPTLPNTE